ncbi:MAG: hypothetical protein IID15_05060 [Candidatus Marinimicrobia bacterium]|nr:hypothetical protein [Candidatus Neomarinimicrobiota bacterium]
MGFNVSNILEVWEFCQGPPETGSMKIAVFIDYWNLQLTLNSRLSKSNSVDDYRAKIDWKKIGELFVTSAGNVLGCEPDNVSYEGVYIYTSFNPASSEDKKFKKWATTWLDRQPGVNVQIRERKRKALPRCRVCHREITHCPHDECKQPIIATVEKGVDTLLVTDLIRLAVANSLMAVQAGATHVQGTISGVGERCGNANLTTILPALLLKMGCETGGDIDLTRLTEFSREVCEVLNMQPDSWAPYVGKSAFAHKGGVHVNAIMKNAALYEHIEPETVGNIQRVLISDLSGKSNIDYKARELGFKFSNNKDGKSRELAQWVKNMEYEGYQFDGAEASLELVIQEQFGDYKSYFELADIDVHIHSTKDTLPRAVATLKVEVDGQTEHTAAEGVGPVHAMDVALRKALVRFFPSVAQVKLVDYKVRVLDGSGGTSSKVRVLITSSDGQRSWSTVGVSENIIEASWLALRDSLNYHLYSLETAKVSQLEEH